MAIILYNLGGFVKKIFFCCATVLRGIRTLVHSLSRARVNVGYPEHVLTWEGYGNESVSYPEHVLTWEGYSNRSVSYPEHVLTWEGYGNRSVSYPEHVLTWLSRARVNVGGIFFFFFFEYNYNSIAIMASVKSQYM